MWHFSWRWLKSVKNLDSNTLFTANPSTSNDQLAQLDKTLAQWTNGPTRDRPSRCRCGGNRWRRRQRCTLGTFSGVYRNVSSRTRSRRRGSTLSAQRPLHESCSTDTSNGPAGRRRVYFYFLMLFRLRIIATATKSCALNKTFPTSAPHLVFINFLIKYLVTVANALNRFLGFVNLPAQFRDVLLIK